ncbi:MAG: energy transducer TonB [Polaromonas sp.]
MNATLFSSTAAPPADAARQLLSRNALVALAVVALHVGFIWALQSGLLIRTTDMVVPVEILSQFVDSPVPSVAPTPAVASDPIPKKKTALKAPVQQQQQQQPLAMADATPAPSAPTSIVTLPAPAAPGPVAAAPAMPAGPAAAVVVQLPSSNADYLQNPKPPYPPLSVRLGETGKVVYKVWIGPDGKAQRADLVTSSGFTRLDKAAYETVMRWRYVPGTHNGVAQTMPVNVPIDWELRD